MGSTEGGVTSAPGGPATDNPPPAPGAFVPGLILLFSHGKCPSRGKDPTKLYEGSSLTPAHN